MSGTEGPTRCQEQREKRWHNKKDEKEMVQFKKQKAHEHSSCEASRTRKTSIKKEGPSRIIYPSSHGVITLQ